MENESMSMENKRRKRGPSRPFPLITFEKALELSNGIIEHGIDSEIPRLSLMDKLQISPSSQETRDLITSSGKYGLTKGSYQSDDLQVTDKAKELLSGVLRGKEAKETQFNLALGQFKPFSDLFEKLENHRLPDTDVLLRRTELSEVNLKDRPKAIAVLMPIFGILDY